LVGSFGGLQGCFFGFSTILLALFLYFRNEQPLKFRDYRSVCMFYLAINVEMAMAVAMGNMVSSDAGSHDITDRILRSIRRRVVLANRAEPARHFCTSLCPSRCLAPSSRTTS
jgi:hypothetical protein